MKHRIDETDVKKTRLRIAGFCLAAAGLILGAFALSASLGPVLNTPPTAVSLDWIVVEGIGCAALSSMGFLLLVLGSDQFGDGEEEQRDFAG
ncbi:hypothetical protein SH661x_001022 [Planctomicrobium sp. SH661]|uniref:hypothetical protein n=1 Tax=Planctomicrobium sp. SH661 TaxID=3448124 RepID=UPI003F5BC49F